MKSLILVASLATGCEDDLLANVHDGGPDAAPPDAHHCTAPTTDAHGAAQYTLLVNFGGAMMTHCSDPDSRVNCSELVPSDVTIPPFMDGNPARDTVIAMILYSVSKGLAPYSIDVVTTRPITGNYYMVVVGGTPELIGIPSGIGGASSMNCLSDNRNRVSLVFDFGQMWTNYEYANNILSNLTMMVGLPVTTAPANDCACRSCVASSGMLCTFGTSSPVTTDPAHACGLTIVDEPAMLETVLGCR